MPNNLFIPPIDEEPRMPGAEAKLDPPPQWAPRYRGSDRLKDKVAIVTGADSGIGRAVAALFAREGADVAILYLNEHEDAQQTAKIVTIEGRRSLAIAGDVGDKDFCDRAVAEVVETLGGIDIAPHVPDEHLRHVLPDAGGAAASEVRLRDRELHIRHDV